jgi:hypothetical protein
MLQQSIFIPYSAICCARLATFENIWIYHSYLHGAFDLMAYMINNHVFIPDSTSQPWETSHVLEIYCFVSVFFMQLTCLFVSCAGLEEEEKRRAELGRRWRSSERLLGWRWVKEVLGTGRPVLASLPRPCPHPSPSWLPLPQPYSISRASPPPQAALLYSSKNKYSNWF